MYKAEKNKKSFEKPSLMTIELSLVVKKYLCVYKNRVENREWKNVFLQITTLSNVKAEIQQNTEQEISIHILVCYLDFSESGFLHLKKWVGIKKEYL